MQHENKQQQIVGAIVLVGVLIAGAILLRGTKPVEKKMVNNNQGEPSSWLGQTVSQDDHILGNINQAKIVIVEYSDLECPFCKVFHATMHKVVNESKGEVAWVYRHYPIPQLHKKAWREAEATECAWDQGGNEAFWSYTNRIFEVTQSNDQLEDSALPEIAKHIGLNVKTFNDCLSSGKFKNKIQASVEDGNNAGVTGTPSSFILVDGKLVDRIPGALPFEQILQKIDNLK